MAVSHGHGQQQAVMNPSPQNTGSNSNSTPSQPSLQQTMQPQLRRVGGSRYDDLPIDPRDYGAIDREQVYIPTFESACQHGPLSTVQSIVSETPLQPRTRSFLHRGLAVALEAGNIDIARYLLSVGAPIVRQTPNNILRAPSDQQIPLFELLLQHGWTVNTPGFYGAVFLPRVVAKPHLFNWFLLQGANPNLGEQRGYTRDRDGGPDTDSCDALECAAGEGNVEAVRLLLDAGAEIQNGIPLHYAAGACPPGMNPHVAHVTPSKEFDTSRIPVMALLVERGADVNKMEKSRHVVPKYAIVHAVMAGAVERVRWLLEHGADLELKGRFGSLWTYGLTSKSEEIRSVFEEWAREKGKKIDT